MKQRCVLLALVLLVFLLCACSSSQNNTATTLESVASTTPVIAIDTTQMPAVSTTTPILQTETVKPIETSCPTKATTETPCVSEGPVTARPENSFSPIASDAGAAYLRGDDVANVMLPHGIVRFLISNEQNPALPFSVACQITNDRISAMLPDGIDLSALRVSFQTGYALFLDGKEIKSGDAIDVRFPRTLIVQKSDGLEYSVTLDIQTLRTGLPSVALTVDEFAEIDSKDYYFSATFYVGGGDPAICDYAASQTTLVSADVKGRGNTSWSFPKKGYTVKLAEKKDLLGLGKSRNWTLVSSYQDKSLMRNEIASHISKLLGLETMETRSVDLWLNGSYNGTYLLIEKIEFENERLDYPDYDEVEDPADAGLLFEWDGHVKEVSGSQKDQWIQVTEHTYYDPIANINFIKLDSSCIVIHKPNADNILFEHMERAEGIIMQIDAALKSHDYNLLSQYIDLESFAAWYLVEDIMKNMDAQLHSSCYMYAGGDGILHMGPVWDFDMSLGNANYGGINDPYGAYIATKRWFKYLFEMKEFCQLVSDMLQEYDEILSTVPDYIDSYAAMLERSQTFNFERWDILDIGVAYNPPSIVEANTYEAQIEFVKAFYLTRLEEVKRLVAEALAFAESSTDT